MATARRKSIIIGATALALVGGAAIGTASVALGDEPNDRRLEEGSELLGEAGISVDQAIAAAESAASGPVGDVELEREGDRLVFEVEVGESDVLIDATDGSVIAIDADDADGDDEEFDDDRDDYIDPADARLPIEQAIEAARAAVDGTVEEVELERYGDRVVYSVEIGPNEVIVDANDGSIVAIGAED